MKKIYEMITTASNGNFQTFPAARRRLAICSVFLLVFLLAGTRASAATINVSSLPNLQSAINSAVAGDVLVLDDGTYTTNMTLTVGTSGITVRPATLGGAYLNDIAAINIAGNNITFSGFQFTSRVATNGTIITVIGDRNILTQLNFDGYSAQKYINLQGRYNEVSYCNFKNKPASAQAGNLIHIVPNYSFSGYNKISHCSFQDMPGAGGINSNECIRISNDATSTYVSRTIIEYNYFSNTGPGDSEAISVKCRENVLRYNTFTNNQNAMMCFRNGDSNVAYGNFFINSGGIRVKEANNIYCYNNYFENCGDGTNTAPVKCEYVSPNLNNINFIHNTIIGGTPIVLASGATNNTWANNVFKKTSGSIFTGSNSGINWAGNIYQGTLGISIPSGMTSTNPQLALNSNGYYGLSLNSPAIDASSTNYPAILNITNVNNDASLLLDISGQSRPTDASLKDVGCDEYGTNSTLNRPLSLSDVGPAYLLGGPHSAPSVSLTAPFNGQEFLAPASISLTASASSATNTITTVGFYNGTNLLGSATNAPYTNIWANVVAGSYSLTARATDNSGAVSTSAVAVIQVRNVVITTNIFATAGLTNWVCPPNVTAVVVECWGGGGAGGSAQLTGGSTPQYGGGGAGGAYAKYNVYRVIPGSNYSINVGAGGFNNFLDNDAQVPGGDSWVTFSTNPPPYVIIAKGGAGGESAIGSTTVTGYGLAGTGTTTGSAGDVVHAGGSGFTAVSSQAGGGGSSAGTNSNGTAATSNIGATAPAGGGNGGTGPTISDVAGGGGFAPGGGGSGGRSSSGFLKAGGRGASGKVVLSFVSNAAPVVILTSPANGEGFFRGSTITLTANASDADGVITNVLFKHNNFNLIGSVTNAPYVSTWSNVTPSMFAGVVAGTYTLTAFAYDNSGRLTISSTSIVTVVDRTYPLTVNNGSGSGPYTNGTKVTISAVTPPGKAFTQWTGDTTPYVASVNAETTTVTMSTNPVILTANFDKSILTVINGSGSGAYTNGAQVGIVASNAPSGQTFDKWTNDTQYVVNPSNAYTGVNMSTNPVTLYATYKNLSGLYNLTVNGGSGSGTSYTNGQQVVIVADAPASEKIFDRWTGDTQVVASVTSATTTVTISNSSVALTATYTNIYYALTVNGGTGGGLYTNGARVTIMPTNPPGMAFDRWTGSTQVLSSVFFFQQIVTMSTSPVTLTATFQDATNGVVNVNWGASGGFYFRTNAFAGILGPTGSGKSTIARLMYSPNAVKDQILPGGAGAVNDVAWDTITITENGDGVTEWAAFSPRSVVRAWTNGYVYTLIFQDGNVEAGDWYYYTPLLSLAQITTNAAPQNIEMNTDIQNGDPINGTNYCAQVITGIVLTVNNGITSGSYTNTQVVTITANTLTNGGVFDRWTGNTQGVASVTSATTTVTMSTNAVTLTATYKYFYTLSVISGLGTGSSYTNGQRVPISANLPEPGKSFDQWIGTGAPYLADVTASNTAVISMPASNIAVQARFKNTTYALTVNSGSGSGSYTIGTPVTIVASNIPGAAFYQWTGDTSALSSNTVSTTVSMPSNAVSLTATYYNLYALTVSNGTGSGSFYTNTQVVTIVADAPLTGMEFDKWVGDTQYANSVTATTTTVTMPTNAVNLTATYKNLPGYYTLTITNGTGSGVYTTGTMVPITAVAPAGTAFARWIGDTQVAAGIFSLNTIVTMPASNVALTASCVDASNGVVSVDWGASAGLYFADTYTGILAPNGSSNSTITQLMYSPDNVKDDILSSRAGAVNDVVWDTVVITENGDGWTEWGVISQAEPFTSTVRAWTNGYVYALTFQKSDVQPGDWYFFTTPLVALQKLATNAAAQFIEMNTDTTNGDPIDGGPNNAQVIDGILLTVNSGSNSGWYTNEQQVAISADAPAPGMTFDKWTGDTSALSSNTVSTTVTMPTNPVTLTATYKNLSGYYTLTVSNGTPSGVYSNGQVVAISADAPASDKVFFRWIGDTQVVASVTSATTTVVNLSTNPVTLTATYADVYYTLTANGGIGGSVSPASTNVLGGSSVNFVITASNYYRIATLTTNGTAVTGMSFDANSTTTNFTWSNVHLSGVLAATFAAYVANDPANTPHWWLASYGLTNGGATFDEASVLDQDSDGLKAWQEYIAGTSPTDAASVLKAAQTTRNVVTWNAVSGRVYSVYWSTNLMKGFQPLETNILYPRGSYTNATPDSRLNHYQIKVRMQ
ncbi:MAG: Ig-like domain-containing protein [Kiritimatiellales bacterium]